MDARTQRTLLRLGASLIVLAAAVIIVEFVHDDGLKTAAIGLAVAAIFSLEEWLRNSTDLAAPTVTAVNAALQSKTETVEPPKIKQS